MNKTWLRFVSFAVPLLTTASVFAQEGAASNANDVGKFAALAAGLGMGIAAAGCGLGQGRAAAAALEGIARNPGASDKIFTPMILGLALIESLAIYSLVMSILLLGKITAGT
jgi:F-type H+-transporting ATPase subunit c